MKISSLSRQSCRQVATVSPGVHAAVSLHAAPAAAGPSGRGVPTRGDLQVARMGRHDNSRGAPRPRRKDEGAWDEDDRRPSSSSRDNYSKGNSGGRQQQRRRRDDQEQDEDEGPGWWQVPREERESYEVQTLEDLADWQVAKLETAFAIGRRKVQVQELAGDLGVDRSVVVAWFKEFKHRPKEEVDAIVANRRAEAEAEKEMARVKEAQRVAVEAATGQLGSEQPRPAGVPEKGFIPFFLRKQLGMTEGKRIKGEALRTLESIYDRTPYPPSDVVKGLYELHRLQRDVVVGWFEARRAADGITSSTQKRTSRMTNRDRDKAVMTGDFPAEDGPMITGTNLLDAMSGMGIGGVAGAAGGRAPGGDPAKPVVVTVSKRELSMLRSSMPSPNKYKGKKLAEERGIKTDPETNTTQIGNLQFVEAEVSQGEKMRQAWKYRDAGAGGRRLRLKGVGAAAGAGAGRGKAARSAADSSDGEEVVL